MRMAREFFKPKNEGVYLHVYNHTVSMANSQYPFGKLEKANFIRIFEKYSVKYNIQLISLVVMGNHFHALLFCPSEKFKLEDALKAYNQFHKKCSVKFTDDFRVKALAENSNNISELMRETQREFAPWFNKTRPYKRKGALWQDRFQCQLIQSDIYLWSCLKYIEMNPLRAGLAQDSADYKYSSFGRWQENHPYEKAFIQHILSLAGKQSSMPEFKNYLAREIKILRANDIARSLTKQREILKAQNIQSTVQKARNTQEPIIELFAAPDWHSKKVIGSKEFIEEKYRQWAAYKDSA